MEGSKIEFQVILCQRVDEWLMENDAGGGTLSCKWRELNLMGVPESGFTITGNNILVVNSWQ